MAGDHSHVYKDIYFSEFQTRSNDYAILPNGLGSANGPDYDNVGHQFSRNTFDSGNHNHWINGRSQDSNAVLSSTGGNQPFDNRPPYTIVQYIIYIEN